VRGKRELLVDRDPASVGSWCSEHAAPGTVFVVPSAAARRLALRRTVDRAGVTLGLTFCTRSRFLPLLESRAGLASPRTLSGAIERLLVSEAAKEARVPLFDDAAQDTPSGAIRAFSNLIRALRSNRVSPEQFADAGGDARAAEAYRRFELRRIELNLLDDADRVDRIIRAGLPTLSLVLEDPSFPSAIAWKLSSAAIRASSSCHIGVPDLSIDGSAPLWTTKLSEFGFAIRRGESALSEPAMRATGGVGKQDEMELVAREMLALLRSGATVLDSQSQPRPIRPNDLLGVAPNADYLALLHETCSRLGIPVGSPRRRDASDVPIVRSLLETFRLLSRADDDTNERGLALLASPYFGLSLDACDRVSRSLALEGLGSLRSWSRVAGKAGFDKFATLSQSVAQLSAKLEGEHSPNDLASTLTSLGLDFGFLSAGRRFHLAAGRDDALRLDQQGWDALTSSMSELNEALDKCGVNRIGAQFWLSELVEVVRGSSVRVDAKALDGVHLTIAGAGLPSTPHVFAIGWREGVFPRRVREDPLMPDRVKKALNASGAMLPLAADRTTQEYERRERIRRAARESLTISWPSTGDEGDLLLPSFYMTDLGITGAPVRSVGDTTWPLRLAASRSERFAHATLVAKHWPATRENSELDAVRGALMAMTDKERPTYDGTMSAIQRLLLPPDILAVSNPLAASMSASQVRMVVHCLYEHFGKQRLKLEALTPPQVDMRLLGTIAHGVLSDLGREGFDPTAIAGALARWWDSKIPASMRGDARVLFEREMLLANLDALVGKERAHLAASGTMARYFELSFGLEDEGRDPSSSKEGLEIRLPDGGSLATSVIRGSIDRVDTVEREGKLYGVAIDYKSGKGEHYNTDMNEMADFQLPIYCEVLPRFQVEPVGAVFLGISSGERFGVVREDFADAFLPAEASKGVRRLSPEEFNGYMRERQQALRAAIARLARGDLTVKPRKDDCGYCDLRPVCRVGTFGVGAAHEHE
jgi:hypothetical protein